jgi:hypothetical protein
MVGRPCAGVKPHVRHVQRRLAERVYFFFNLLIFNASNRKVRRNCPPVRDELFQPRPRHFSDRTWISELAGTKIDLTKV